MSTKTFAFGKNWKRFVKKCDKKRVEVAKKWTADFLGMKDLKGKLFLDVGCGSGLYSLAALELGADVISFDTDPNCIECCEFFKQQKGNPDNWKIYQGSILDKKFLANLPKADIVYSHGVLHHTGKMWEAMENAGHLVRDNGYLYIAIYNKMYGFFRGSKSWEIQKRLYLRLPKILQYAWEGVYLFRRKFVPYIIRFKNPVKYWKKAYEKRGESILVNLRDWLGGYPYEYARPDEVFNFYKDDFILVNLLTKNTLALNVFLFKKKDKKQGK